MKHFLVMGAVAMMAAISVNAQTNLSGRVYHNPNIVTSVLEQEVDSKIVEERKKAIDKKEKEKGGKLTKKELADLDKAIADIKKKCLEEVKSCSNQWKSSSKTIIDKATKSQKRKIAKEKTEKKNKIMGIIFFAIVPLILFVALWIYFASITAAAAIIFFYYCICVFVAIKM